MAKRPKKKKMLGDRRAGLEWASPPQHEGHFSSSTKARTFSVAGAVLCFAGICRHLVGGPCTRCRVHPWLLPFVTSKNVPRQGQIFLKAEGALSFACPSRWGQDGIYLCPAPCRGLQVAGSQRYHLQMGNYAIHIHTRNKFFRPSPSGFSSPDPKGSRGPR